ncbi:MAG: ferredoxin, partial [Candidatus Omnitrophica bacterium]|nr:ferredoxin [Candidatus Omnitrophota bacterium]
MGLEDKSLKYSSGNFGLALDIGTTTISAELINLENKKVLGTKTSYNKQASFGADIITRIIYAGQNEGLEKLHDAVSLTVNQIIQILALENKVNLNNINSIVCAGNTTMIHLLLKIDPAYIRKDPY